MKIFRRAGLIILAVKHFRRLVIAVERLAYLYEQHLRAMDVPIYDTKLSGTKEGSVELSYGPAPVVPGQVVESDEYSIQDFK